MKYNTRTSSEARMPMFDKELFHDGHVTRITIRAAGGPGWEVQVERDSRVVRRARYTDWHRVERALGVFSLEASRPPDDAGRPARER